MPLPGREDGGAECSIATRVRDRGLLLPKQGDSEDGTSGAEHIGVEDELDHPFRVPTSLRGEITQGAFTERGCDQKCQSHLGHHERWDLE